MNQPKMNLDKAHPSIRVEALANGNRFRRFAAGLGGSFLFGAICVLVPSVVEAQCPQWDVSGSWTIQQSDGYTVQINLQQTGKKLTGKASYFYDIRRSGDRTFGAKYPSANGSASGNIGGADFYCEIKWETGPVGVYTATVSPGGRIHGTLYDKSNPNRSKATWFSTDLMHCGERKTAGSNGSAALNNLTFSVPGPVIAKYQTPQPPAQSSPKRVISHKGKGRTDAAAPAAVPNIIAFNKPGQTPGTQTLTWDGGPDHPNAAVWVKVDGADETKVVEQGKGTRQVTVEPGKTYQYVLTDAGQQLATTTVKAK
jgi:hypothetical protein